MENFYNVNELKGNPIFEQFNKYSILSPSGTSITDGKVLKKREKLQVQFTHKRHSNSLSGLLFFKGCKIYNFS